MKEFTGKTVFITGGTGSFGQWSTKELLKTDVAKVIIFSRDEMKQLAMKRKFGYDDRLQFIIGNVRDYKRLLECLHADIVYHASALKIIPVCEEFPQENMKTNLFGAINVRNACIFNRVKKALYINTDKAVKPTNSYGIAKAMAEKIWLKSCATTIFSSTRYGNVIGSRGSVVPFFKALIEKKKTLPITDLRMRRFLITLQQAVDLIFHATEHMKGGEVFVPQNPACLITDLAVAMVGATYPTEVVGIRAGEKIDEVLVSEHEIYRTVMDRDFFKIMPHGRYESHITKEFSSASTRQLCIAEIKQLLREAEK